MNKYLVDGVFGLGVGRAMMSEITGLCKLRHESLHTSNSTAVARQVQSAITMSDELISSGSEL